MPITSYDNIINSISAGKEQQRFIHKVVSSQMVAGGAHSLWMFGSMPVAGSAGGSTPGLWTAQSSSTTGAIAFANPGGSDLLHLILFGVTASAASAGTMMLYDRLGQIEFLPLQGNTTLAITSDFTARLDTGEGAQIFGEISTTGAMATTAPVFQITNYTNQAGTSGRASEVVTGTIIASASAQGRFPYTNKWFIGLQAGDTGVRSVSEFSLTTSSGTAGVKMNLVAARPLTFLPMNSSNVYVERDCVLATVRMPRIRDNACLALAVMSAGTGQPTFNGNLFAVAG
jgi:hypothetical protein